ncbi:MAG: VWA domain-containing protein [Nanoarchaeota archaeon]|nr:VWA domain-containing protein [Nanoarchaeota archaeon]MCK5629346.1 VWA domain-containing protein [Nanoarchaeota archaeon]
MVAFDSGELEAYSKQEIDELEGSLAHQEEEDKLMHSVLENDKETIDDGHLINESLNKGIGIFAPDMMFEQLVKDYSYAKKLFGETIIRQLSGYDPGYVEKNIRIPEFQREIKRNIAANIDALKDKGMLNDDGSITDKAITLASLILYTDELDNIIPKGFIGEKIHKKEFVYGEKSGTRDFRKNDRYRDIALRRSVKLAVRRGHKKIEPADLKSFELKRKGQINVVYLLDASGSMKGIKLETAKKAGIALAYKAIEHKDKVGLIVFGSEVKEEIVPTLDFVRLLKQITTVKASRETDIANTIRKAIEVFPRGNITKHIILLTDALPTVGKKPESDTLEAVSIAQNAGITISVIGIQLDAEGKKLAEKVAALGEGRLYIVRALKELDSIVLEDYYSVY